MSKSPSGLEFLPEPYSCSTFRVLSNLHEKNYGVIFMKHYGIPKNRK